MQTSSLSCIINIFIIVLEKYQIFFFLFICWTDRPHTINCPENNGAFTTTGHSIIDFKTKRKLQKTNRPQKTVGYRRWRYHHCIIFSIFGMLLDFKDIHVDKDNNKLLVDLTCRSIWFVNCFSRGNGTLTSVGKHLITRFNNQ